MAKVCPVIERHANTRNCPAGINGESETGRRESERVRQLPDKCRARLEVIVVQV